MKNFVREKFPAHYELGLKTGKWPINISTVRIWKHRYLKNNGVHKPPKTPKKIQKEKSAPNLKKKSPKPVIPRRPEPYSYTYPLTDAEKYAVAIQCNELEVIFG